MQTANKFRKQEPPPNKDQIGSLRPLTDISPVHDLALNLPSGPPPVQCARDANQEVSATAKATDLERRPEPAAAPPEKTGLESGRSWLPPHQQISHAVSYSAPQLNQLYLRYQDSFFYYEWGELVVQVRIGERLMGHVKIVGLKQPGKGSSPLIAAVLGTKNGLVLGMKFEQEDVYNLKDFRSFCAWGERSRLARALRQCKRFLLRASCILQPPFECGCCMATRTRPMDNGRIFKQSFCIYRERLSECLWRACVYRVQKSPLGQGTYPNGSITTTSQKRRHKDAA